MRKISVLWLPALLLGCGNPAATEHENTSSDYMARGEAALAVSGSGGQAGERARNIIIFVGDGMGVSTITAARIFAGQAEGLDGESYRTATDGLQYTALVKTYSHDAQVADSAPTATAILTGVKTRNGVIGIGPESEYENCASGKGHRLPSLFGIAQTKGLATGIVTTTRITHATPAAAYAHTVGRNWESDVDLPQSAKDQGCIDIARQLIEGRVGSRLDVIMGGGRAKLAPNSRWDMEYLGKRGGRADGRDLIAAWERANPKGLYAWNSAQLSTFNPARDSRILGLFEPDHMQYDADNHRDRGGEPRLAEMVETAIKALSRNKAGYVLLVEGGRIDHAHHAGNAYHALSDARALDEAVAKALSMASLRDTLIVTTADHSHTLTIGGDPVRNNPILGDVIDLSGKPAVAKDGKGYTTLSYANGPGAKPNGTRPSPDHSNSGDPDYLQQALVPLEAGSHSGEDVVVRASGPGASLLHGTIEQNDIFNVMRDTLFGQPAKEEVRR